MRRPISRPKRDMTDTHFRRALRSLGFKGKYLPLSVGDIITHPNRPNESAVLQLHAETRHDACDRLRTWAYGEPKPVEDTGR